jgi:hypothetical protein
MIPDHANGKQRKQHCQADPVGFAELQGEGLPQGIMFLVKERSVGRNGAGSLASGPLPAPEIPGNIMPPATPLAARRLIDIKRRGRKAACCDIMPQQAGCGSP